MNESECSACGGSGIVVTANALGDWTCPKCGPEEKGVIEQLCDLLREANIRPYMHVSDCGMWDKKPCDKQCGRRARGEIA